MKIKWYKFKWYIFIIIFSVGIGFICSKASNVEIKPIQSDTQKLVSILEEWKNVDINK